MRLHLFGSHKTRNVFDSKVIQIKRLSDGIHLRLDLHQTIRIAQPPVGDQLFHDHAKGQIFFLTHFFKIGICEQILIGIFFNLRNLKIMQFLHEFFIILLIIVYQHRINNRYIVLPVVSRLLPFFQKIIRVSLRAAEFAHLLSSQILAFAHGILAFSQIIGSVCGVKCPGGVCLKRLLILMVLPHVGKKRVQLFDINTSGVHRKAGCGL